jgi:SagB-type dehydrogenase family enzyme
VKTKKSHQSTTKQKAGRRAKKLVSYRRCASVVIYWQNGRLIFENFALGKKITADPLVCSILQFCEKGKSLQGIESYLSQYDVDSVRGIVEQLCLHGLLESSDHARDPRQVLMETWKDWNPAAGFFHFATKDVEFAEDPWVPIRALQARAKSDPMPLAVKKYSRAARVELPRVQQSTEFPRVLKERRTWRRYSDDPVPLEALAATLELTFGIQGWAEIPGLGRAAMKTSPSGGSLHPIEAYVVAQRVRGLGQGIYHYNADDHQLEWLGGGVTREALKRDLGQQHWFADTAFLILMTAVFGRTQWKYDFARVYRAVLLEAGHLCQTFCLTATWQGLAPFCTIALADTKWEGLLGIDGITESVIYAAGAGMRPADDRGAHIGKINAKAKLRRGAALQE